MPMSFNVSSEFQGVRLDRYLTEVNPSWTRTQVKQWIEHAYVSVNQAPTKASYKVKTDDSILVDVPDAKPLDIEAVDLDLDIVYQDDVLLVINKPSGLIVHPSTTSDEVTLVHGLLAEVEDIEAIGDRLRPGIVHRLDKDTSGLMVVAKTKAALLHLQNALKEHKANREYLALVEGIIPHQKGKIDAPIGRDPKQRKNMAVVASGKPSVTHFEVLERFPEHTLIRCRLESGRTHQIRVHLKYIGFPVYGDPKYGHRKTDSEYGQFLHATKLGFSHPMTKQYVEFECPLPDYFQIKLSDLRG